VIVVDSSVWIAKLRGQRSEAVGKLDSVRSADDVLVGDLILLEVLQGARDDRDAARIEHILGSFEAARMVSTDIARQTAANFRILRAKGLRVRATVDLLIGTYCIEHGHFLLHQDRDFDIMEEHLGLRVL
jgi:predicted nucleic acid-binding protein